MPPGTGDAQITITQRVPLKGAVIVSTPQDIALIDAQEGRRHVPEGACADPGDRGEHGVFVCANCGHEHHIFGHGGARETAEKIGAPFLGEIPLVPRIRETSDAGTPISASAPDSPEAKAFMAVAEKVKAALEVASQAGAENRYRVERHVRSCSAALRRDMAFARGFAPAAAIEHKHAHRRRNR